MTKCENDHDTETTIIKTEELQKTKTKTNIPSVAVTSTFFSFSKRYIFDGFGDKILAP